MLEFREININDKDWIRDILKKSDFMGCEYSFANNLAWRRLSDSLIARYKDFYIVGTPDATEPYFTYPAGEGDIEELFYELAQISKQKGNELVISSVNNVSLTKLKEIYGDRLSVSSNPDYYDYIYNSVDLIEMKGKKYHGKRNHIKRFKDNEWSFMPINESDFDECIAFAVESYNNLNMHEDHSAVCEQFAIHTFFDNFHTLELKGGVLRQNNKMVGFTIGEQLNSETFVVHIEKALSDVQGAYPTICNEFAKMYAGEFKYINREEDLGIEGLRKSKKSYNPAFLLEKHTVTIKI